MVEQSDRAPLLDWEEPNQAARPQPEDGGARSASGTGGTITTVPTAVTYSPTRNRTAVVVSREKPERVGAAAGRSLPFPGFPARDRWEEKDQIVAVFVVTFDTRSGEPVKEPIPLRGRRSS